jgi:hypothetical protein
MVGSETPVMSAGVSIHGAGGIVMPASNKGPSGGAIVNHFPPDRSIVAPEQQRLNKPPILIAQVKPHDPPPPTVNHVALPFLPT